MSYWEKALLVGLVATALVNIGNWRAWLWLTVGAADYIVTSAYYETGLPLHPFVTACVDALACIAIYIVAHRFGGHRWELPLFTAFQFSVLVSTTKLLAIPDDYQYALLLELVNWSVLLIIGGTGIARLADVALGGGSGGHLHRALRALFAPAEIDPWWWGRWIVSRR